MKTFFGGLFLGIGILVAFVSGLCSLVMLVVGSGPGDFATIGPLVLMFGGIPLAVGLGLFFIGRSMLRSARSSAVRNPEQEFE